MLGYANYESGLVTAGTWNANPTRMELYRPGVPLPGAVVQTVYASTTTTQATGTGTTKVATALTGTITPTSAANPVKVSAWSSVGATSLPSAGAGYTQIWRNTGTTAIGNLSGTGDNAGAQAAGAFNFTFDNPQTTNSTQYGVYITNQTAGNNWTFLGGSAWPSGGTGIMLIEEVMG